MTWLLIHFLKQRGEVILHLLPQIRVSISPHFTEGGDSLPNMQLSVRAHLHPIRVGFRGLIMPSGIKVFVPIAAHFTGRYSVTRIPHSSIHIILIRIPAIFAFGKYPHHARTTHFESLVAFMILHNADLLFVILTLGAIILHLVSILDHIDYFSKLLCIDSGRIATYGLLRPIHEFFTHQANIIVSHNHTSLRYSLDIQERICRDDHRNITSIGDSQAIKVTAVDRDQIREDNAIECICGGNLANHRGFRQSIPTNCKRKLSHANSLCRYICLKDGFIGCRAFAKLHTTSPEAETFRTAAFLHDRRKGNRLARLYCLGSKIREFNHRNIPPFHSFLIFRGGPSEESPHQHS
nr:MAG TPA: hypothetical protein [Caudoviricetes sp.]